MATAFRPDTMKAELDLRLLNVTCLRDDANCKFRIAEDTFK